MILIISYSIDKSTNDVIDWLNYYQSNYIRFNTDKTTHINISEVNHQGICSYWYRKGVFKYESDFPISIQQHLREHYLNIFEYLEFKIKEEGKRMVNSYFNAKLNKLIVHEIALKNNLRVPKTFLLNRSPHEKNKKYIYKTLTEGGFITLSNNVVANVLTNEFTNHKIGEFATTLFQEKIEKKYELRIFYLNGNFWSMAIFSQNNEHTSVDFRNYNNIKPNRSVPYELPEDLKISLNKLMLQLKLNSGSIDVIVSTKDEYYFLEVNPVGQFGMVSIPCNYHIEKELAKYLNYE